MSVTEEARREATDTLRRDYWDDVRGLAESVRDELNDQIKAGERGEPLREWLIEHLDETVDGTQRVIYTHLAKETLLYSDNADAFEEDFGTEGMVKDGGINWAGLAYCALRADVLQHLDALGVDMNDPDPDEDEDQDEDDATPETEAAS